MIDHLQVESIISLKDAAIASPTPRCLDGNNFATHTLASDPITFT
jgi:hypothetical protein